MSKIQVHDETECQRCGDDPSQRGAVRVSRVVVEIGVNIEEWLATFECVKCREPYAVWLSGETANAVRVPAEVRHDVLEVQTSTLATWRRIRDEVENRA